MNDKEQREIFSKNLINLLSINQKSQKDVAEAIGVSPQTFNTWCKGVALPRMGKVQRLADYFGTDKSSLIDPPSTTKPIGGIRIPVLGRVAAGIPIEAIENIVDYEEIPDTWQGEYAALKVKGDSMLPRIQEGDVLIVKRQSDAESGDIVVAMVNGEDATVKKLIKKPDGIVLQPLNPLYEPLFFSLEQRNSIPVEIWGKVVENRQKF